MSTIVFTVNDTYPNLSGTAEWPGSVKTDTIAGIMVANGEEAGQFTGALVMSNPVSEDPTLSSVDWAFDVLTADTAAKGKFKLCVRLTHDNGDIETIKTGDSAQVDECG